MIFILITVAFLASIIGALAPGASNALVVKTAMSKGFTNAKPIIYGAGVGEIILALAAFYFGFMITSFLEMNLWAQLTLSGILMIVGIYIIARRPQLNKNHDITANPYLTGFFLSTMNPPVLLYWIIVFTILHRFHLNVEGSNLGMLFFFMAAVFAGKVLTLLGYARLGKQLDKKERNPNKVNKIIGGMLLVVGVIQVVKVYYF